MGWTIHVKIQHFIRNLDKRSEHLTTLITCPQGSVRNPFQFDILTCKKKKKFTLQCNILYFDSTDISINARNVVVMITINFCDQMPLDELILDLVSLLNWQCVKKIIYLIQFLSIKIFKIKIYDQKWDCPIRDNA